jgi:chromosome segregation ATPase
MNVARQIILEQAPEEHDVEARIAKLESDVEHIKVDLHSMRGGLEAANESITAIRVDVSAIKATLPHLATRDELKSVEGSLSARINAVEGRLDAKINALEARLIRWMVGTTLTTAGLAFTFARLVG